MGFVTMGACERWRGFGYNHRFYKDFPINLRLVKLNHHCQSVSIRFEASNGGLVITFDGVGPSAYRRASNLIASSCRTWDRYLA